MAKKSEPRFDDMSDAFDYCREANKPVVVCVLGVRFKLYPSGRADSLPCIPDRKPAPSRPVDSEAMRRSNEAMRRGLARLIGYPPEEIR